MIRELQKKGVVIKNGKIVQVPVAVDDTAAGFGPGHGCGSDNHQGDIKDLLDKNGGPVRPHIPLDPRVNRKLKIK